MSLERSLSKSQCLGMSTDHSRPLPSPHHRGQIHQLTDAQVNTWVKKSTPLLDDKILWLTDGGNLQLALNPGGAATWFAFVPHNGGTRQCQVGVYPDKLALVRERANEARQIAAQGENPNTFKRRERERLAAESRTFEEVSKAWIEDAKRLWKDNTKRARVGVLNNHFARESFYRAPMRDLTTDQASNFYSKVADYSGDVASDCMKVMRGIVAFANGKNYPHEAKLAYVAAPTNLKALRLGGRASRGRMPAITDLREIAKIFWKETGVGGSWQVKGIHRVCALTAQRIGAIVLMKWADLDLEAGVWRCRREDMKKDPKVIARLQLKNPKRPKGTWMDDYHDVPLSTQAIAFLKSLPRVDEWVFPSPRIPGQPVRPSSVDRHLRETLCLDGLHVPHGYRSTFETWRQFHVGPDGKPVFGNEITERLLDHETLTILEWSYTRKENLELLRPCIQAYCDDFEAVERQLARERSAEQ